MTGDVNGAATAPPGLETLEGLRLFAEEHRAFARRVFEGEGDLPPLIALICTDCPAKYRSGLNDLQRRQLDAGRPFGSLIMAANMPLGAARDGFASYTRHLIRELKAIGVVTAFEVWSVTTAPGEARPTGDYGEDPRAKEYVVSLVERDTAGRGLLGPFEIEQGARDMKGRFTDLLDRTRFA